MGANFQTVQVRETDDKKLRKWFQTYQEELRYEYGHEAYNGTMSNCAGLSIDTEHLFCNDSEAHDYIIDRTDKWGSALAVRVFVPTRKFEDTTKGKTLHGALLLANKTLHDFTNNKPYTSYHNTPEYASLQQASRDAQEAFRKGVESYHNKQFKAKTKRPKHFRYVIGAWCAE
jgi:hypothetical protein